MFRSSTALLIAASVLAGCTEIAPTALTSQPDGFLERIDGWNDEGLDLYFVPGSAAEDRIAAEIAAADTSIRVAMYNLRSDRVGWMLVDKQAQGVDVELLLDAKQMVKEWNTLDDDLIVAGLNVVPITNDNHPYATLHDKLAVIDGSTVFMGSGNWGTSGLHDNNEAVLALSSPVLAQVVDEELDQIVSGIKTERSGDVDSHTQLYFSPEDRLDDVVESHIDAATDQIQVAVFSLRLDSLADALVRAHQRGVEVHVITDLKQSDQTDIDEDLVNAGIAVVEALNETTPYTAMHHKFMVVDGHTTLVGSYNWSWTASNYSYEDLAVIADDTEVAAAFAGEFGRVWDSYSDLPNPVDTSHDVSVQAWCDRTQYGDNLVLVGDLEELGGWDPHQGVVLSGEQWPTWTADLSLRAGARFEYKWVVVRADGSVWWEQGGNRSAVVPTDPGEPALVLDGSFRP